MAIKGTTKWARFAPQFASEAGEGEDEGRKAGVGGARRWLAASDAFESFA